MTLALLAFCEAGYGVLGGEAIPGEPLWLSGCTYPARGRIVQSEKKIPSKVVSLPEEGWKARTLTIPPWSYSVLGLAARHWMQDNLLANEVRVGVGFDSGNKLWDSVKNLGNIPYEWLQYATVSGDVSQCTDSTSLVVHDIIVDEYLTGLETGGVSVPSLVWISAQALTSSHQFLYTKFRVEEEGGDPEPFLYTPEAEHQTGIMMGEGLSFIVMTLQNLMLDDEVVQMEREIWEERVGDNPYSSRRARERIKVFEGSPPSYQAKFKLCNIVGDDYQRMFSSLPKYYSELAFEWFSWEMSKGKNGISWSCGQLAEEWVYIPEYVPHLALPPGKYVLKQDVIKGKYFAVPGTDVGESPPWIGRAAALSQALDWCGDVERSTKEFLIAEFRNSYDQIPKVVPIHWCLPPSLGGISYPTMSTAHAILKKMRVDFTVPYLLALPDWELQATLKRLSHSVTAGKSRRGVAIPRLAMIEAMLGGFYDRPEPVKSDRPVSLQAVTKTLLQHGDITVPRAGWRWNHALACMAPSRAQVCAFMTAHGYTLSSHAASRAARAEMLTSLARGDTVKKASFTLRSGREAQNLLSRVLRAVENKVALDADSKDFVLRKWKRKFPNRLTVCEFNREIAYLMGESFVQTDSLYALMGPEVYPWSFTFRPQGGIIRLPRRRGEFDEYEEYVAVHV